MEPMSPTPRIAPLAPPYPAEVAPTLEAMMPPGEAPIALFRAVARNPRVLARLHGGHLLDRGSIPLRVREIVILRTTARCRAEYEWGVHVAFFAAKAGLDEEQIAATVHGAADAPCWSRTEAALIATVDALHDEATLDAAAFARLAVHYAEDQIIEILALAGQYHMIAFLVNALALAGEPGAPRFPARRRTL